MTQRISLPSGLDGSPTTPLRHPIATSVPARSSPAAGRRDDDRAHEDLLGRHLRRDGPSRVDPPHDPPHDLAHELGPEPPQDLSQGDLRGSPQDDLPDVGLDRDGLDRDGLDRDGLDHVDLDHVDLDHVDLDHVGLDRDGRDHSRAGGAVGRGRVRSGRSGPGPSLPPVADRLPGTLRRAVLAPTARAVLVLTLVALAAAAVAGWQTWRDRPVTLAADTADTAGSGTESQLTQGPLPEGSTEDGTASDQGTGHGGTPSGAGAASPAAQIAVDVAGMVSRPGVVRLPLGSRVVDALDRAGGVLPGTDTTGLPLARLLVDGEQILVDGRPGPAPPAAAPPASGAGAGSGGSGGLVNLNTATVDQLDALPGVGPVLAQRILDWRSSNGPFAAPEQLGEVSGVGDRRLADLLPLVTV